MKCAVRRPRARDRLLGFGLATAVLLPMAAAPAWAADQAPAPAQSPDAPGAPKRKRQPPPPVIPTAETLQAQKLYQGGSYEQAVAQAKAALNKNERYTPAMLIMAKSYYKLRKYEWVKTLWEMMQNAGASDAEKAEMYQILGFLELEKQNVPGTIELFKKATDARPENAVLWNNLGAEYLTAKNYKEAVPALEKATQLQPTFSKAFLNLGSAYRGVKDYAKSEQAYKRALQLFPNYADAVFDLGILYLDADKMPNTDFIAQMNTAVGYLQRYKQMVGGQAGASDPSDQYILEAQEKIKKEQKRIERQKKQEERDRQRAAQKPAGAAAPAGGAPAAGSKPAGSPPANTGAKTPVVE